MSSSFSPGHKERNNEYWYQYGHDALEMVVEEYAVDDQSPGAHGLLGNQLALDDFEWGVIRLRGQITVPGGLSDHVFESDADPETAGRLFIRADCIRTHNRFAATVIDAFDGDGEYEFEIPIERDRVAESVRFEPVLIRGSHPSQVDYSYGQTPGMRLADGEPFILDSTGGDEGETFLPVEAVSFEEEDRDDHLFYLDHSVASEPVLYIDSDVELLETALKNRARHGVKRWTKETLERLIVQPVWVELILWTASDLKNGKCQYGWQKQVISSIATVEEEPPEDTAGRLEAQVADVSRVASLAEDANENARAILAPSGPVENLLDEVL